MNLVKNAGLVVLGISTGLLAAHFYSPAIRSNPVGFPTPTAGSKREMPSTAAIEPTSSNTSVRRGPAALPPTEASSNQQQADARATLLRLDDRLRSEPVDHKWAMEQEETILSAISGDRDDGFPAALPENMETQCRSTVCKVTMTFKNEEDAFQMQTKLTLGLRGPIAAARTFYDTRPDGGMDLVIYAGTIGNLQ